LGEVQPQKPKELQQASWVTHLLDRIQGYWGMNKAARFSYYESGSQATREKEIANFWLQPTKQPTKQTKMQPNINKASLLSSLHTDTQHPCVCE